MGSTLLPTMVADFTGDKKLDAIGVITGPGSFTGIRMGLAYAKGLAMGLNTPLVGMNVFEVAEHKFPSIGGVPAGRGGFPRLHNHPVRSLPLASTPPQRGTLALPSDRGDFYTYDGKDFGISTTLPPDARLIENWDLTPAIDLAAEKLRTAGPEPILPLYIRPSYVG